jgi:hypothetical protein
VWADDLPRRYYSVQALSELIEMGYLKEWDLMQPKREPTKEYEGMPSLEEIRAFDPYFVGTQEGLAVSKSSFDWLSDESNALREEWLAGQPLRSKARNSFACLFLTRFGTTT